jgi:hypothetical protein
MYMHTYVRDQGQMPFLPTCDQCIFQLGLVPFKSLLPCLHLHQENVTPSDDRPRSMTVSYNSFLFRKICSSYVKMLFVHVVHTIGGTGEESLELLLDERPGEKAG